MRAGDWVLRRACAARGRLLVSEPEDGDARPTHVTETLVASGAIMPAAFVAPSAARVEWSADFAVTELYELHYRALVRLAALVVRDTPTAEEVVQDAFVAMHGGWQRLRDAENALAYLRQAVMNRSRSVLRHRTVVDKNMQKAPPDMPSAEHGALAQLERSAVVDGAAQAAGTTAPGDRPAVLRGPFRGRDRGGDADQPWCGQESHRARNGRAARGAGTGDMVRPGRGFDGSQGHDFGEFLRRELHAAGDQIQPGADGLERIREKIRSRSAHASGRHGVMAIWGGIAAFGTSCPEPGLADPAPAPRGAARPRAAGAEAAQGLARGDAPAGLRHWPGRVPHRGGPGRRAFYSQ